MTRRHSRAWHLQHDAALAEIAHAGALKVRCLDPSPIDALAAPSDSPMQMPLALGADRHSSRSERRTHFLQTGDLDG